MGSRPWLPAAVATAVAGALAVLLSWPVALHPTTLLYGYPGDATGTVADLWWWSFAPRHGYSLLDNPLVGAPIGSGWDLIPFDVLQLGLLAPLSFLVGPVAAYNLFALLSYPLTALLTFLLARRLGMGVLAAGFTALAFAFMPLHTEKAQAHLMQAHMEFLPAFLLLALRWRLGGSFWNLVAAGAVAGLTLWNDTYMTYILVALAFAFLVASLLRPAPRHEGWHRFREHGVGIAIIGVISALFVPFWLALGARSGGGYAHAVSVVASTLQRGSGDVRAFSARPWEYVLPWSNNPLVPASIKVFEAAHLHGSNFIEQSLFLGFTVLALAAVGVAAAASNKRWFPAAMALGIAGTGLLMSLPPTEQVVGVKIRFPSDFLIQLVPYFRVYSRFGMIVMLGVALLAGLGLDALVRRLSLRGGAWLALAIVPFLTLAAEFTDVPPSRATAVLPAPAEYTWLRDQPAGIVVEYPLAVGDPPILERQTRQYSMYQMVHQHSMFNGAPPTSPAGQYAAQLEPYYAPESVRRLQQLGITYVFVHGGDYRAAGLVTPRSVPGLIYVTSLGDTDIFLVGA